MRDKRTEFAVNRDFSLGHACSAMICVNLIWVIVALFVIGGLPLVLLAACGFHLWLMKVETHLGQEPPSPPDP